MKAFSKITLLTWSIILLASCSREESDWKAATATASVESYEQFLSAYPESALRDSVQRQLARMKERAIFEDNLNVTQQEGLEIQFLLLRAENLGDSHPLQGFPLIYGRMKDSTLMVMDCFRVGRLNNMEQSKGVELTTALDMPALEVSLTGSYRIGGFWAGKKTEMTAEAAVGAADAQRKALKAVFDADKEPTDKQWLEFYSAILAERLATQDFGEVETGWLMITTADEQRSVLQTVKKMGKNLDTDKIFVVSSIEFISDSAPVLDSCLAAKTIIFSIQQKKQVMKKTISLASFVLMLCLGAYFGQRAYYFTTQKWMAGPIGWGEAVSIAEYEQQVEEFGRPMANVFADQGLTTDHWYEKLRSAKSRRDNAWLLATLFTLGGLGGLVFLIFSRKKTAQPTHAGAAEVLSPK